jgi:hypothetical protein
MLAPAGWNCSGIVGADGGEGLDAYPSDQSAPSGLGSQAPSNAVGVSVNIPSANTGPAVDLACPYFPNATSVWGPGTTCQSRLLDRSSPPAGEVLHQEGPNVVEFEDPPGVTGLAYPSGGDYPANGVVVWDATVG